MVRDNYDPPTHLPQNIEFRLAESVDWSWRGLFFGSISTPGHTPAAHTILLPTPNGLVAFCGDATCGKGRIWQPHALEWDHWTPSGIRSATAGLRRLRNLDPKAVLPAHGALLSPPSRELGQVIRNLNRWADTKDDFVRGTKVSNWPTERIGTVTLKLLPDLFMFGRSAYLLHSKSGEGLVVDMVPGDEQELRLIMREQGVTSITMATATHFHGDHASGLPLLRKRFGAALVVPAIFAPITLEPDAWDLPARCPPLGAKPDAMPTGGTILRWNEYTINVWDFPGQTKFHAAFSVSIGDKKVLFSGDNFFMPRRYGGSGGCSFANRASPEGYAASARLVLKLRPDLLAAGHHGFFPFSESYFRSVLRWASKYRRCLDALHHPGDHSGYYEKRPGRDVLTGKASGRSSGDASRC